MVTNYIYSKCGGPAGPPGVIVAPSGAVYKPEECGMDGNGNGWCAGEAVPAEAFMKEADIKSQKKSMGKVRIRLTISLCCYSSLLRTSAR